jgi:hypothetical protein
LQLEIIPLAEIARATGVSDGWLQAYVNAYYATVPQAAKVFPKARGKLNFLYPLLKLTTDIVSSFAKFEKTVATLLGDHIGPVFPVGFPACLATSYC